MITPYKILNKVMDKQKLEYDLQKAMLSANKSLELDEILAHREPAFVAGFQAGLKFLEEWTEESNQLRQEYRDRSRGL